MLQQGRPELIEEYRRETDGNSVHLMPLSDLLKLFEASTDTVANAKEVEKTNRKAAQDVFMKKLSILGPEIHHNDLLGTYRKRYDKLEDNHPVKDSKLVVAHQIGQAHESLQKTNQEISILEHKIGQYVAEGSDDGEIEFYIRHLKAAIDKKILLLSEIQELEDKMING